MSTIDKRTSVNGNIGFKGYSHQPVTWINVDVEWQFSFPVLPIRQTSFMERLRIAVLILFARVLDLQAMTITVPIRTKEADEKVMQA